MTNNPETPQPVYWFRFTGRNGQVEERQFASAREREYTVRTEYGFNLRLAYSNNERGDVISLKDRYEWGTTTDATTAKNPTEVTNPHKQDDSQPPAYVAPDAHVSEPPALGNWRPSVTVTVRELAAQPVNRQGFLVIWEHVGSIDGVQQYERTRYLPQADGSMAGYTIAGNRFSHYPADHKIRILLRST